MQTSKFHTWLFLLHLFLLSNAETSLKLELKSSCLSEQVAIFRMCKGRLKNQSVLSPAKLSAYPYSELLALSYFNLCIFFFFKKNNWHICNMLYAYPHNKIIQWQLYCIDNFQLLKNFWKLFKCQIWIHKNGAIFNITLCVDIYCLKRSIHFQELIG